MSQPDPQCEPWTIVLVPSPDPIPVEIRVRRLLKWARELRLRAVCVRDATADELEQVREWEV
jgi:hypothetical protein